MKLYEAYSMIDDYRGFKDVQFHWFVSKRQESIIMPEKAITGYTKLDERGRFYALDYMNELLTENEVEALRTYLKENHDTDLEAVEVKLPIWGAGTMGVGALPVGGLTDFYMLAYEDNYDLDVPIWGYYDLGSCEEVKTTTGTIIVGHDHAGATSIVITLHPGDGFSWEHPLTLIPHIEQTLEGIALSQLGQVKPEVTDDDSLPF